MADDDNWLGLSDEEGGALPPAPTSRPQSEAPEAAAQRPAPLEAAAVVPRVVPSGLFGNNGEGGYPPGALRQKAQCTLAAVGGTSESDDGLELSDADSEGVDGGAAAAAAVLLQTYATQVQEQRPEPTQQQQQQQQQQQAPAALVAHGVTPTLPPPSERPESHALVVPEALPGPAGRVQHTAGATGGTAGGWAKAMEQQQQLTAEQATDDGDLAADAAWALLTRGVLGGAWPADGMHSIAEVLADGAARRVARVAGVLRQREAGAAETGQVHCVLTDPSGSMTATLHDGAVDSLPALSGEEDPAVLLSDVPLLRADKGHVSLMVMANRIEACVTATGMAAP